MLLLPSCRPFARNPYRRFARNQIEKMYVQWRRLPLRQREVAALYY